MKKSALVLAFFSLLNTSFGQQVFFQSSQKIEPGHLKEFYSSITMKDSLLLFNAPDYNLYAYNTATLQQNWSTVLNWKSNIPPRFVGNDIWASGNDETMKLSTTTGERIGTLPFTRLETQPFFNNGIYYGTAIYDGGCLYAYDPARDSILWTRFLAHGCSVKPYYLGDKIIANAEADNWIEVSYDGKLKDPDCENAEVRFPSELACAMKFIARTHDDREITGSLADKIGTSYDDITDIAYSSKHTFVVHSDNLAILQNKLKLHSFVELPALSDSIESRYNTRSRILKADDESVWVLYNNSLINYSLKKKEAARIVNLTKWRPHQAILDGNRLWLISREDGRLYGLTI